jgi:predicted transcriptional regulator
VRLSDDLARKLDDLASNMKVTRSEAVRRLVEKALSDA